LLFALILVSACTDTSQPPVSPAPTQILESPETLGTSGTPGALVTTEIPATTNTPGSSACSSGQTLCDGSCIDTQRDSQHCGACGNVCNEGEPCLEGKCLSWTGSWIQEGGWKFELTQTGTSVSGTDNYKIYISGSTSGNPPRLICNWDIGRKDPLSTPCTFDMAPDGKSFTGGLLGCNILTYTREED
jgi:hypothetical protein